MHITIANDRIKFQYQNTTKIYSNVALEKEGMKSILTKNNRSQPHTHAYHDTFDDWYGRYLITLSTSLIIRPVVLNGILRLVYHSRSQRSKGSGE